MSTKEKLCWWVCFFFGGVATLSYAQVMTAPTNDSRPDEINRQSEAIPPLQALPQVVVSGTASLRLKEQEVRRVETLRPERLEGKQAQTFATMIDRERGIDMQTSCAFCGSKRLTINGLRGEHTTILVDGLSLHSTVSGFYGIEAIPIGGIDSIDVYRGSGSALTAPEAIGGAINIRTSDVLYTGGNAQISYADDGQYSVLGTATKRWGAHHSFLLTMQNGEITPVDYDHNRIAEVPRQQTLGITAKYIYRPATKTELSLRLSYASLNAIGGTTERNRVERFNSELIQSADFEDFDVRKRYLGPTLKLVDQVDVHRMEAASIYKHENSEGSKLNIGWGLAQQFQDAIYSHGYDYGNTDSIGVLLVEYDFVWGKSHLIKLGLDTKWQEMDSRSERLFSSEQAGLPRDNFQYQSIGAYVQDTWSINKANTLSTVLRADHLKTEWLELENQIERFVLAPRLLLKHDHSSTLTSRLGAGLGYRAPLTLFESQHGTNHYGFIIDIDRIEEAQSLVYSLAGQWHDNFFEFSTHLTRLENMAYGQDYAQQADPTVFQNSEEAFVIPNFDISYGRRWGNFLDVEAIYESFHYPDLYKRRLPVATVEQRFTLLANLHWGGFKFSPRLNWTGARDLSEYANYSHHFNVVTIEEDIFSDRFGEVQTSDPKRQNAPAFFTADLNVDYQIDDYFAINLAALNLNNFTQTGIGDSPTTWHVHGNHYHLDNFHLWGPTRGRQIFVGLKGEF